MITYPDEPNRIRYSLHIGCKVPGIEKEFVMRCHTSDIPQIFSALDDFAADILSHINLYLEDETSEQDQDS